MEWKDISIKKYMALKGAMDATYSDVEQKTFAILSILNDKDSIYFENLPINVLKQMIEESKFIYEANAKEGIPTTIRCGGKTFNVEREISNLVSGQYIDLTIYCKSENIINQNYHNIISLFLSPVNWMGRDAFKQRIAKAKTKEELIVVYGNIYIERKLISDHLYEHLTMDVVFQISHYFFLLYQNLINSIQDYSEKQVKTAMKNLKKTLSKNGLQNIGDGILL